MTPVGPAACSPALALKLGLVGGTGQHATRMFEATWGAVWFGVRKPGAWLSGYTHRPRHLHQVRCLLVLAALKL